MKNSKIEFRIENYKKEKLSSMLSKKGYVSLSSFFHERIEEVLTGKVQTSNPIDFIKLNSEINQYSKSIKAIGININQVTKMVYTTKSVSDKVVLGLTDEIKELNKLLDLNRNSFYSLMDEVFKNT